MSIQWIAGGLLGVMGTLLVAANYAMLWRWFVKKQRGSLVGFLGGIATALALAILPIPAVNRWWFIPLLLDPGTGLLLVFSSVFIAREIHHHLTAR